MTKWRNAESVVVLWVDLRRTAMEGTAVACGALGEAVGFLSHFSDLPDRRQAGKVIYPLDEVLLLCLLAVNAMAMRPSRIWWSGGSILAAWTIARAIVLQPSHELLMENA